MERCKFCGAELPAYARFCGNCGALSSVIVEADTPTSISGLHLEDFVEGPPSDPYTPTFISSPAHPPLGNGQQTPLPETSLSQDEDEDEEHNILLPDLWPWGNVQTPGNVPVVHGTPNINGVPVVHGTPPMPAGNGLLPETPSATAPASPSATQAPPQSPITGAHPVQHPLTSPMHPITGPHLPETHSPIEGHPVQPPHPPHTHPVTGSHPVQSAYKQHAQAGQVESAPPKQRQTQQKTGLHKSGSSHLLLVAAILAAVAIGGIGAMFAIASTHRGGDGNHPLPVKPAHLTVRPSSMNLGTLAEGSKVSLAIVISNAGQQRLQWKMDTGGTRWLKVVQGAGLIEAGKFQQGFLEVNTAHLKAGSYMGTVHITSNGGNQDVSFTLAVINRVVKQARLYVDTTSLDFGRLPQGQPATLSLTVGNVGTDVLNWQANTASSWLTLSLLKGSIVPKGQSQTLQITANTTNLTPGSYSTTLQIQSNGGNTQVGVSLIVQATPQPVQNPVLAASVSSFSVPGDSNCAYDQTAGWTCTVVLSSYASAQTNLSWSASNRPVGTTNTIQVAGVTFTPSSDTIPPGKTEQVSISIPNVACSTSTSADFAFTGSGNTVDVLWSCAPPQMTTNPTSFSNGCHSCTVTLGLAQGSEGGLSWSATGVIISGITVSPASGTIFAGQTAQVTFSVPSINCPANADLNFTGQNNGVDIHVPWDCQAPILSSNTKGINANTDCPYNNGWTCTVTLTSDPNAQSDLNWSASGGVSGTIFKPSSGTLPPGQPVTVMVTVPGTGSGTSCPPTQTNLTFTGPGNTITIPWSCSPGTLKLSNSTFNVPDASCPYTAGTGWTCTETLSLANQGDPDLSWNTAGSVGGSGIQYSPANGTLSGSQNATVTITIPDTTCPTAASLDFLVSGGKTVSAPWTCAAPQLTVSPPGVSTCPQNSSDGSWTCTETLSLASGSQGSLNWSASTSLSGVNINPSSGTLSSSGSGATVTINIPATDCTNSTFTFAGQNSNTVNVQWQCSAPQLTVTPASLTSTDSSTCPYDSNSSIWRCTLTLSNQASNGNSASINWSASTSLSGVTFDNTSGTIQANQSQTVTMTIPASACTSGSFTFQGTYNTVTVQWSCTPPSTPSPSPTSTSTPTSSGAFVPSLLMIGSLMGWVARSVRRKSLSAKVG